MNLILLFLPILFVELLYNCIKTPVMMFANLRNYIQVTYGTWYIICHIFLKNRSFLFRTRIGAFHTFVKWIRRVHLVFYDGAIIAHKTARVFFFDTMANFYNALSRVLNSDRRFPVFGGAHICLNPSRMHGDKCNVLDVFSETFRP